MRDYRELARVFADVGLDRSPVSVTYLKTAPEGVSRFKGTVPSGCSFWRLAAENGPFYAVAADHYNCPVGSYTHGFALPPDRAAELPEVLNVMTGLGYLRMEEVPGVAKLDQPPAAVMYAPLSETAGDPDVVVFVGQPGKLMLLEEAAVRAGRAVKMSLGRPTCMALPAALSQGVVASSGCIGNRVYTGIGDASSYLVINGRDLEPIAAEIATIVKANAKLRDYHEARLHALSTS